MREAHFLDTSALIKRYIDEDGTAALHQRCFESGNVEIFVSAITYAETYATLRLLVRDATISIRDTMGLIESFERDWRSFLVVEFNADVRRLVPELSRRYALRGADLVQLASALLLWPREVLSLFVACDLRLTNAATETRISVFNPEENPGT
ncbi:MAG: type II toxin-antitoxin system VapC family toxin [Myxococcota bacterium]